MREEKIIRYLLADTRRQSVEKLAKMIDVSPRTISTDIKKINSTAASYGFKVSMVRGQGYALEISDKQRFDQYLTELSDSPQLNLADPEVRKVTITLLLLFAEEYLTIGQISETLAVSGSTVKNDLIFVREQLEEQELTLYAKPYYGYKIVGSEEKRRELIIRLLRNDISKPQTTPEYAAFLELFDEQKLRKCVTDSVKQLGIKMNDLVLDNLILHIILLSFRIQQNNLLKESQGIFKNKSSYAKLTERIAEYLETHEDIRLPENEKIYLSRQLYGKMLAVNEFSQYDELHGYIDQALAEIDQKYRTHFYQDKELKEALALHVAPLLQRLYVGHQLENPIIEDVYTRYANVFTIAYDFIQLISNNVEVTITKDEMGYLAIYFAASLEKKSQEEIKRYKRLAVICATGGGASYLLKTKLEQIFVNAEVQTFSIIEAEAIDETYDLIISTVPIELKVDRIPVIYTQALLTEKEIKKIQNDLLLIQEDQTIDTDFDQHLLGLFTEKNFTISNERDYLRLLEERADRLEENGEADSGYRTLVLRREHLVDTIYHNGIAGPHPMEAKAIHECIDVIIVRPAAAFKNKQIRLIFLINIGNGHLFIHKEISRLMIRMIDDQAFEKRLDSIRNYEDFSHYLREMLKRG
ncbi:BglG family transcription antiterminator [Enterococcus sp. LJL128]|uniref:BglG family transcription antiterminator n=1 Tax=Enterococcus sp. LJL51 TaxID=3416656 RepID=UPI003CF3073D